MKSLFIILWKSLVKFKEDDCISLSAAISFVFIFSLVPFLTLAAKIFQLIQQNFSRYVGIDQMDLILKELTKIIPFISSDWLKTNIIDYNSGGASLTIVSILMLPAISGLIFHELETAYKKIFNIGHHQFVLRQFFYTFFTILVLLFIFLGNFTWVIASSILKNIESFFKKSPFIYHKIELITRSGFSGFELVSIFVLVLFFLITSKIFLPSYVKIDLKNRLIPAIIFAFLWVTARTVFSIYIEHISLVNIIYGSLSSVILILMWIFYASVTLLFSVEIMHTLYEKKKTGKKYRSSM